MGVADKAVLIGAWNVIACCPCTVVGLILVAIGLGQQQVLIEGLCTATASHKCERRSGLKGIGSNYRPKWNNAVAFDGEQDGCIEFYASWHADISDGGQGECNKEATDIVNKPVACKRLDRDKICFTTKAAEEGVDTMPGILMAGYVALGMGGFFSTASICMCFSKFKLKGTDSEEGSGECGDSGYGGDGSGDGIGKGIGDGNVGEGSGEDRQA
eukprot:TRINITY_DN38377_c0_g1_i1.p1 TRINITY_DN38377_c0_g1~~TRINITY_DN38377_c0_g1_i1.p1  ORF type:complete len:214 (-),score=34.87 TRINITY_DN38377_c0_g1_i1:242-883(-)